MTLITERRSTRLEIPHPNEAGCRIVGILEEVLGKEPTDTDNNQSPKRIALILHGAAGHKDYLFQKRLALRLPIDSFRFDFRGNHETPGTWSQSDMDGDLEDLKAVVAYLRNEYRYEVDLVVGHSRGSLIGFRWMCTSEEGKRVSGYVNASSRYRMKFIHNAPGVQIWKKSFKDQGYHNYTPTVARKVRHFKVYPEDLDKFANWDTSLVWDHFPPLTDVFTIHGLDDKTVAPYDAIIYSRALGARALATHNLHLMEGADHNFSGMQDEVVDNILDWWNKKELRQLKTGVWMTGRRVKL